MRTSVTARRTAALAVVTAVILVALVALLAGQPAPSAAPAPASLVLRNGRVVTLDPARPEAQAIAVSGDRIAFVGSDAASEVTPTMVEGVPLPVHTLLITALGIHILDNQDLERLSDTAARLKRWEFMLTINPVPVTGGTGSPLNTLATF